MSVLCFQKVENFTCTYTWDLLIILKLIFFIFKLDLKFLLAKYNAKTKDFFLQIQLNVNILDVIWMVTLEPDMQQWTAVYDTKLKIAIDSQTYTYMKYYDWWWWNRTCNNGPAAYDVDDRW